MQHEQRSESYISKAIKRTALGVQPNIYNLKSQFTFTPSNLSTLSKRIETLVHKPWSRVRHIIPSTLMRRTAAIGLSATLLATASIPVLPIVLPTHEAEAAWYSEDWNYRKRIEINSSTDQQNVYYQLTLDTSDSSKFLDDCSDLRFTTNNGSIIPHHIVSGCGSATTQIQLLFGELLEGDQDLFVYYGNPSATITAISEPFNNEATGIAASIQSEESSAGPVAHWKFDEGYGTTTYDSTSNANDGTMENGPTWQDESMCVSGKCLYFDGEDDSITVPHSPHLTSTEFTISFWLKVHSVDNKESCCTSIMTKQIGTSNRNYVVYVVRASGKLAVSSSFSGSVADNISNTTVDDSLWRHVNYIVDDGEMLTYVDGVLVDTLSVEGVTDTPAADIIISAGGSLKGALDEFKIYNYPRSQSQIQQDYVRGVTSMQQQTGNLSNGLVGHWKMDEANWNGTPGEVRDSSGNGNNGTAGCTGSGCAIQLSAAGKFGNGASFDGNVTANYIQGGISALPRNAITYSLWLKLTGTSSGFQTPMHFGDGSSANLFFTPDTNRLRYRFSDINGVNYDINTGYDVPFNEWHHITISFDGFKLYAYVDGLLIKEDAASGQINYTGSGFWFGAGSTSGLENGGRFNGSSDEVRLYSRSLNKDEIRQLYNYAPKPVGYWDFEEGSGNTVYDNSGNGNDGNWAGAGNHYSQGKIGRAGDFNGESDYSSITNYSKIDYTRSYTTSAWINPAQFGNNNSSCDDKRAYIISISSSNTNYSDIQLSANQSLHFKIRSTEQSLSVAYSVPDLNRWYFVSAVLDESNMEISLYVNGILKSNLDISGATILNPTGSSLRFGHNTHNCTNSYFEGSIDEVKIYNYARTQQQIIEDMQAGQPAVNSPIGHWKFDEEYWSGEAEEVKDSSGFNNHASASLGTTTPTSGIKGKAGSFNGVDSGIQLPKSSSMSTRESYTVSTWINPANLVGTKHILQIAPSATTTGNIGLSLEGSVLHFMAYRASTGSWPTYDLYSPNNVIQADSWSFITVVADNFNLKIYVNGKKVASGEVPAVVVDSAGSYDTSYIGRFRNYGGNFAVFDGLIDELKIYNHALTPQDILVDYNQSSALVAGATSTETVTTESEQTSTQPSNSANSEYCVPGDTSYCAPPVGEWNFEEKNASTIKDSSGNANDLELTGVVDWESGKYGSAMSLSSSGGYARMATMNNIPTETITVSAWVKIDEHKNYNEIVRHNWINNGWLLSVNADQAVSFGVGENGVGHGAVDWGLSTGEWHHLVGTYDGDIIKLYIDGKFVDDATRNNIPLNVNGAVSIGGGNSSMDGVVDQVRIYDYARTPAQVAWEYNKGMPVAHYKFDECQGSTIHDSSGNNLHAVMNLGSSSETSFGTCESLGAWGLGKVGKLNSALNFDGVDDRALVSDISSVLDHSGFNPFTLAVWFKWDGNTIHQFPSILDTRSGNTGYLIRLNTQASTLGISRWPTGPGSNQPIEIPQTISPGEWYHIVGMFDGQRLKAYLNGTLMKSNNLSGTAMDVTTPVLKIGGSTGGGQYFGGLIDDIQIFNYALTEEQVRLLHNGGAVRWE